MKKMVVTAWLMMAVAIFCNQTKAQTHDTLVVITTQYGVMKLKLYDDTPLHKRNFIKLASQGFYDSLLFHRVIKSFMIQGGDPSSKTAKRGDMLGNGDVGYKIPAEFVASHYHKKGALSAARESDDVNPSKASSGCQFYIVQGKKFTDLDINTTESRMASQAKQAIFNAILNLPENEKIKQRFIMHQQARNFDSLAAMSAIMQPIIEAEYAKQIPYHYTAEQKLAYSTIGGAPHLDANYTVFGEVIEGLEVIDKIAEQAVDGMNRPLNDLRMKVTLEIK